MSEPAAAVEARHWSHTRLSTYLRCPLAYKLGYIDEEPEQVGDALRRGREVHEFCEAYARECYRQKEPTLWSWGREQLASYPPDVREIGERFIESTTFDWNLIVADGESVERPFALPLPDGLGILRGRCDLVQYNEYEGNLVVTDYKSGFQYGAQDEECPPQMQCYGWAMAQEFDVQQVTVIYRHLGNNETRSWDLWDPQPSWAMSAVRRVLADDRFEPTPSARACGWCGHRHLCPVVKADPVLHPETLAEAREAWGQYQAMYARAASVKQAVRDYLQAHELDALPGVEERPGWYPTDPTGPPAREVKHSPVEVMQAVVQVLGEEVAAKLVDARALGTAVDDLGGEGFGDAPELDALLELTAEKAPGNPRWSDAAPRWWRELTREGETV